VRNGRQTAHLTAPGGIRIQTIGPDAATWFQEQCPEGKTWDVTVWVEIVERNA